MWISHYELNAHEQKLTDMSREEYTKYMLDTYPELFKDYYSPMSQTCMCWGFDINSGWYHVLDSLCSKLYQIYKTVGVLCQFEQVKEKYGQANFYHHCINELQIDDETCKIWGNIINTLVNHAEEYCDYIDDILGTNCNPSEKIVIGRWYYGCTKEGYSKHIEAETNPERKLIEQKRLDSSLTVEEYAKKLK